MKLLPFLTIALYVVITILTVQTAGAQCVRTKIKANLFRGVVLTPHGDPYPGVKLQLLKGRDEARVALFEAVTDRAGSFNAGGLKPGEYLLWISAGPGIDEIVTELRLGKSPAHGKRSFLTIKLGIHKSSSDSCEGDVVVSRR